MSASTHISRRLILVTGPARSGKSEWAEMLAQNSGKRVIYAATSRTDDTDREWCDRIRLHRSRRPPDWKTLEVPVDLAAALTSASAPDTCILVDSLGTWLANLLEWDEP
ncbi:MAG: bifunctional adenosylcobinamide kinase/adenosylcobinamide-phosphate guanylyltransferase, partial [Limnospira sp.]